MQLILCKDNANERNESLLSNCRVQLILCKDKKKFGKQMKCVLKYLKENSQLDSLLPPTEGK